MSTQQDFSEYTAIIDISPDSCGEATQEQVNEIAGQIRENLESIFPGIRTDTGFRTSITGPDEETCEEIHRAIFRQFERKMADITKAEPSPEDIKAMMRTALTEAVMLRSVIEECRAVLQDIAAARVYNGWELSNVIDASHKEAAADMLEKLPAKNS